MRCGSKKSEAEACYTQCLAFALLPSTSDPCLSSNIVQPRKYFHFARNCFKYQCQKYFFYEKI